MKVSVDFLIADVARLMRQRFDERARQIGVTRPQWRTLLFVSRNEGANQNLLAELLEVEPITLCRMIDRLQETGLLERRRDEGDRRAWQIFLTSKALPILERLRDIGDQLVNEALAGLSPQERDAILNAAVQIQSNLSVARSARN